MISIQTNYAAMVGEQNLATNNTFQTNTIEQLTSGYRINNSGNDPAGLAVANQYSSDVAELTQGVINGNSGVSTLQIMDGGMSNISTMLNRMKTLATEAASGTFTGNLNTVQAEFSTLQGEIDREADNIGLGVDNNANAAGLSVYIGGGAGGAKVTALDNSQVAIGAIGQVDSTTLGVGAKTVDVSSSADALAAITAINTAISTLGSSQGVVGAGENDLNYAINLASSQITNFSSAESQIRDADVASEAANLTKAQVLQQASVAAMAQANAAPQALLKLLQ